MKSFLLSILFYSLFITSSYGQIKIRPYLGISINGIFKPDFEERSYYTYPNNLNRKGYFIGAELTKKIFTKFSLNLGVQYSRRGSQTTNETIGEDYNLFAVETRNIDFIPQLEYTLSNHFSFHLGTYASLHLSDYNLEVSFGSRPSLNKYNRFSNDFGLVSGASFEHSNIKLRIDYLHGIKNLVEQEKSRSLQIGIGYVFEI